MCLHLEETSRLAVKMCLTRLLVTAAQVQRPASMSVMHEGSKGGAGLRSPGLTLEGKNLSAGPIFVRFPSATIQQYRCGASAFASTSSKAFLGKLG